MKVYISIPITGLPIEEAKEHAEWLKASLEVHGHMCITPFEVCPEPGKPYAYYMGKDIEALLSDDIDAVVFGVGWSKSKGSKLEKQAATIYGKIVVFESAFRYLNFKTLTINKSYNEKEVQNESNRKMGLYTLR